MIVLGDPNTSEVTATYTWVVSAGPIVPVRYATNGAVLKVEEIQVFITKDPDGDREVTVKVRGWRCKNDGSRIANRLHTWETADRVAARDFYEAAEQWASKQV